MPSERDGAEIIRRDYAQDSCQSGGDGAALSGTRTQLDIAVRAEVIRIAAEAGGREWALRAFGLGGPQVQGHAV